MNEWINARGRICLTCRLINIFDRAPVDSELTLIDVGTGAEVGRKPGDMARWLEQSGIVDCSMHRGE